MGEVSDDIVQIRALIPDYPGYADEGSRTLSDRLIRAWAGSCLAETRERVAKELGPGDLNALDDAIFRCQFPDQHYIATIEHATLDPQVTAHLVATDRRVLELSREACEADAERLPRIVSAINSAFDERTPVSA